MRTALCISRSPSTAPLIQLVSPSVRPSVTQLSRPPPLTASSNILARPSTTFFQSCSAPPYVSRSASRYVARAEWPSGDAPLIKSVSQSVCKTIRPTIRGKGTSDPRKTIPPTIRGKGTSDPRNTIRPTIRGHVRGKGTSDPCNTIRPTIRGTHSWEIGSSMHISRAPRTMRRPPHSWEIGSRMHISRDLRTVRRPSHSWEDWISHAHLPRSPNYRHACARFPELLVHRLTLSQKLTSPFRD